MIRCSATARRTGVIKLKELIVILDLHREGLTVSAIAERTGLDRKTVRNIERGIEAPIYGPRQPRPCIIEPYEAYVCERVSAYPELSIARLLREIRELGYPGGKSALGEFVREVRPAAAPAFEVRFETAPGEQAQVDFAHFKALFDDEPGVVRVVWLFSMVLGHSRYLFARFCLHQDLQTLLRMHIEAFEHYAGVPREILYDRMKSAVLGEGEDQHIVYNASLLALASHYGFAPRACKAYRALDQGQGGAAVSLHPPGLLPGRALCQPGGSERSARALAKRCGQRARARHHRSGRGRAFRPRACELGCASGRRVQCHAQAAAARVP
jgi:transposase